MEHGGTHFDNPCSVQAGRASIMHLPFGSILASHIEHRDALSDTYSAFAICCQLRQLPNVIHELMVKHKTDVESFGAGCLRPLTSTRLFEFISSLTATLWQPCLIWDPISCSRRNVVVALFSGRERWQEMVNCNDAPTDEPIMTATTMERILNMARLRIHQTRNSRSKIDLSSMPLFLILQIDYICQDSLLTLPR